MPFSSKFISASVFFAFLAGAPNADPLDLLQKHRYIEAIAEWEADASQTQVTEDKLRAIKGQAVAYEKLGSLYQHFHKFFFVLAGEYYSRLEKFLQAPSLWLYEGQMDFYAGNYSLTVSKMEQVIKSNEASPKEKDLAKVFRHYAMNFIRKKDLRLILNSKYDEVKLQIARLDPKGTIPEGISSDSPRCLRTTLDILIRDKDTPAAEIKKILDQLLDRPEYAEFILNEGKLTQVNFYDPMMLSTLSKAFYFMARAKNLVLLKHERRFPSLAKKFNTPFSLAQCYFELGRFNEALDLLSDDRSAKARLLKAQIAAGQEDPAQAKTQLADALKADPSPAIERDAGFLYHDLGLSNRDALRLTSSALRKKTSSQFYQSYGAVLLGIGKKEEALAAYSKGYKIQFRNSIDHINPEYMIDYAFAIFKTSKMRYDEVVETLFHLQKAYPPSRQMHYCMGGISAAEANSFPGGEKIFGKGK